MTDAESTQVAVVDGANVAYEAASPGPPRLSTIVEMRRQLLELDFDPIVIIDATLRHEIDDSDGLEVMLDQGVLLQAPADTSADYFVLKVAGEHDAVVVSNDQFEEFRAEHPWVDERRVPFMVVRGEVHLYRPGEHS